MIMSNIGFCLPCLGRLKCLEEKVGTQLPSGMLSISPFTEGNSQLNFRDALGAVG